MKLRRPYDPSGDLDAMLEVNNNGTEEVYNEEGNKKNQIPCYSLKPLSSSQRNRHREDNYESVEYEVFDVNPRCISEVSSLEYSTFQMTSGLLEQKPLQKSLLSQLRAKTKLKRSRKPYQPPERVPPTSLSTTQLILLEKNICSNPPAQKNSFLSQRRHSGTNVSSFNDWPAPQASLKTIARSKSLDDIRSPVITPPVMHPSLRPSKPDISLNFELNHMSAILSRLDLKSSWKASDDA